MRHVNRRRPARMSGASLRSGPVRASSGPMAGRWPALPDWAGQAIWPISRAMRVRLATRSSVAGWVLNSLPIPPSPPKGAEM